jgi:hypothetical protein
MRLAFEHSRCHDRMTVRLPSQNHASHNDMQTVKKCAYCGRENADEAMFCHECGTKEFATETLLPAVAQRSAAHTSSGRGINALIAHLLGLNTGTQHIDMVSPLSPQECATRLRGEIDIEHPRLFSWTGLFGSKPIVGRVTESELRLRQRRVGRNSFQRVFVGRIETDNGGSIIAGEFGIDPVVRSLMTIWFWGVLIIGGTLFLAALGSTLSGSRAFGDGTWMGLIIPAILIVWGLILPRMGQRMAKEEPKFITDFLARTLGASVRQNKRGVTEV